jgi:hypothetical protein
MSGNLGIRNTLSVGETLAIMHAQTSDELYSLIGTVAQAHGTTAQDLLILLYDTLQHALLLKKNRAQ